MKQRNSILSVLLILIMTISTAGVYAETPSDTEAVLEAIERIQQSSLVTDEEALAEALMMEGISADASEFAYVFTFADLEAAVANPNVGIILLMNDIHMEQTLTIDRDLSISGVLGATLTVTQWFHFNVLSSQPITLVFSNVTLDGSATAGGIWTGSSVTIKGAVITNCRSYGAVTTINSSASRSPVEQYNYISEPIVDIVLENCMITSNLTHGAFISSNSLTVKNCEIINNYSDYGGGIRTSATLLVEDSQISGNVATHSGGGIYSEQAAVTVINTDITNNQAVNGGGLSVGSQWPLKACGANNFEGSTIAHNSAVNGGGIYVYTVDESFSISGGIFESNTAELGGALYLFPDHVIIEYDEYDENGYIVLSDMLIKENKAANGGGIFIDHLYYEDSPRYDSVRIEEDVIFTGNTADTGHLMVDSDDIAIYETQVFTTHFSAPFTEYAYNNFDVVYTKGAEIETIDASFYLRRSDNEPYKVVTLYAGQVLGNALPEGPQQNGFIFVGWVDENNRFYDRDTVISGSVNLYPAYILD